MKYVYPAVLEFYKPEPNFPNGYYVVTFPDVPGCITDGETLADACYMAQDALNLMLLGYEDDGEAIPAATPIKSIVPQKDEDIVTLISADTTEYRKQISKKAVKKTLTIPQWLDTAAQRANINFSNVLQNALMKELGFEH